MTQPHIPAHDADSARDAETAFAPSYPQRSTAQDHSATQELPAAQDATREMPSATTISTMQGTKAAMSGSCPGRMPMSPSLVRAMTLTTSHCMTILSAETTSSFSG